MECYWIANLKLYWTIILKISLKFQTENVMRITTLQCNKLKNSD